MTSTLRLGARRGGVCAAAASALLQILMAGAIAMPFPAAAAPLESEAVLRDSKAAAEAIGADGWRRMRQLAALTEYAVEPAVRASYQAHNPRQRALTRFEPDAAVFVSLVGGRSWELGLRLTAYGYEGAMQAAGEAIRVPIANRMEYRRGDLAEWYVNDARGVEQGFTLGRRPPGDSGRPLRLEMEVTGGLQPRRVGGDAVVFSDAAGQTRARYGGLVAWDANGVELPATLEAAPDRIAILVDDSGAAYPLTIDLVLRNEDAKLTAGDADDFDGFGSAVAIAGDTVVVGAATGDCAAGLDCGAAYVFQRPTTGWEDLTEVAKLTAGDGAGGEAFGFSVSISGDTVVVGAPFIACSAGPGCGAIYLFEKPLSGWADAVHDAKLTAATPSFVAFLGFSVGIDGDTVVGGAPNADCGAPFTFCGAAYVFQKPAGGWVDAEHDARLVSGDVAPGDLFGIAAAISGDTIAVGAQEREGARGAAYVFEKPLTGWTDATHDAKLIASDAAVADRLGASVSISGGVLAAGAPGDACTDGASCGAAYVFEMPVSGWADGTQTAKLAAGDAGAGDNFGNSISIFGNRIAVGSPFDDCDDGGDCGAAYLFERPAGGWANAGHDVKLVAGDAAAFDEFGIPVAAGAAAVVVGAPSAACAAGNACGAAYVFEGRNQPPIAHPGADVAVECVSDAGTAVTLDGSGSFDPDGDALTYTWSGPFGSADGVSPTVSLPLGTSEITLTVDDGNGGSDSDSVFITVSDTIAPLLSVLLDPGVLWPPNNKLRPITATIAADDSCSAEVTVELVSIVDDEGGDPNDAAAADFGTDDREFALRAERDGAGDGRVYSITYSAADASGNSTMVIETVLVPHDQGGKDE